MKRAGTTNGRLLVISILGSAFAAGTLALGMHYAGLETYPLLASMPYRKLVFYLLIAALFFAACLGIYQFGKHGKKLIDTLGRKNPLPAVSITFSAKSIVASTVVVLVLWLPWIAVEYPASIDWDTYNQLYQFFTPAPTYYSTMGTVFDAEYIDHHPVFDTLIFGSFVWLGNVVGSQNMGMFLYALLQCAFTAAALSLSCCYLTNSEFRSPLGSASSCSSQYFHRYPTGLCACARIRCSRRVHPLLRSFHRDRENQRRSPGLKEVLGLLRHPLRTVHPNQKARRVYLHPFGIRASCRLQTFLETHARSSYSSPPPLLVRIPCRSLPPDWWCGERRKAGDARNLLPADSHLPARTRRRYRRRTRDDQKGYEHRRGKRKMESPDQ